jgi:hypothetical protein
LLPPENLAGLQLVKKFLTFYETGKFMTAFTTAPILNQINPVHALSIDILKIHFNIILSSMPRSSEKTR